MKNSLFEKKKKNMKKKRVLCWLLAMATTVSLCGCKGKHVVVDTTVTETSTVATEVEELSYEDESARIMAGTMEGCSLIQSEIVIHLQTL